MAEPGPLKEYTDYEYLDSGEAEYQGYDAEDDSDSRFGFSVEEPFVDGGQDGNDDSEWMDDEAAAGEVRSGTDEHEGQYEGQHDGDDISDADTDDNEYNSTDAYDIPAINGSAYKDPRYFTLMLYRSDVSRYRKLDADEQTRLATVIRKGMLCDCSIMPEDPRVPEEYPYKLVDNTSKVLKRLNQTEEEKAWVESLGVEEKKRIIAEGRAAQDELVSHNLPLVMSIARAEYNEMEYLDRVQVGNLGLMKAAQYFKPYRGAKFATFATRLIKNEIRDYVKKLRKKREVERKWTARAPIESDIDAACELMGGQWWMNEIKDDTGQTPDRIRKQVLALLEQKQHIESIANDLVFGPREEDDSDDNDEFSEVLRRAEKGEDMPWDDGTDDSYGKGDGDEEKESAVKYGQLGKRKGRRKFDILKGDGKPPKPGHLSTEDYIRSFFKMVTDIKDIEPVRLAEFVLNNKNEAREKAGLLKSLLEGNWKYTVDDAVSDLGQLIDAGEIWPERHLIELVKSWGWKPKWQDAQDADPMDDAMRKELDDHVDKGYPAESAAMIIREGYVPLRGRDIREYAAFHLDYYEWLCYIIDITDNERLEEANRDIGDDLADGLTYAEIQTKRNTYSDDVKKRKKDVLLSLYDQIVESSNRENGKPLMEYLEYRCRTRAIQKWKRVTINRIHHEHFTDKEPFALQSRGEADTERPRYEKQGKMLMHTIDALGVFRAGDPISSIRQDVGASVRTASDMLHSIFQSEEYRALKQDLEDGEDDGKQEEGDDPDGIPTGIDEAGADTAVTNASVLDAADTGTADMNYAVADGSHKSGDRVKKAAWEENGS